VVRVGGVCIWKVLVVKSGSGFVVGKISCQLLARKFLFGLDEDIDMV
jgi:hypothetical protein